MKRILVVDDELTVRSSVSRLLKNAGYEATMASNGLEAIELMKATRPDLVILDMAMPELDGIGTCRLMKKDSGLENIPVLFLTGLDTVSDAELALEEHPAGYITKPCDPTRLLKKVESLLS